MLGEGATATVHLATCLCPREYTASDGTRRPIPENVAIKTMAKDNEIFSDADVVREVECMRVASGHAHVLQLYEVWHSATSVQLVLQLARGGELFDAICDRGTFTEEQAGSVVRGLCSALALLHSKSVVHRDVKAENVLCVEKLAEGGTAETDHVVLTDFGNSRPVSKSMMTTLCGTPVYAAPEIINGEGYSTCASDMWSVGVIVYMLLCGYPPFFAEDIADLFVQILSARIEFASPEWDEIAPEAKDLVRGLLTVDPTRRLTAAQVLKHEWLRADADVEESVKVRRRSLLTNVPTELAKEDSKYSVWRKARQSVVAERALIEMAATTARKKSVTMSIPS